MNTPILSTELAPKEQRRRTRAEKAAKAMGFRHVAGKPGWWWLEDIGAEHVFPLSVLGNEMETPGDVLVTVFWHGAKHGREQVRKKFWEAMKS